jgi:hypothetical protein
MMHPGGGPPRRQPGTDVWRHGELVCQGCGGKQNAAAVAEGGPSPAPSGGDWSICFRCGEVAVYVVGPLGVGLREATTAELAEFARSPDAARVREIHQFWADRRRR